MLIECHLAYDQTRASGLELTQTLTFSLTYLESFSLKVLSTPFLPSSTAFMSDTPPPSLVGHVPQKSSVQPCPNPIPVQIMLPHIFLTAVKLNSWQKN